MQIKICNKCKIEKTIDNFSLKHGKCNLCRNTEYKEKNNSRTCKGCHQIKMRCEFKGSDRYCLCCYFTRSENEKESKRKSATKYRKKYPNKIKEKSTKAYKRKYYGNNPKQLLNYRLQACRSRAQNRNLDYNLDIEFLLNLYLAQNNKCAVTGILFDLSFDELFSKRPFSPSVD